MEEWYRCHLSNFHEWTEREHADTYLVFPENVGSHLSIDETSLRYDELYTIVTNKSAKGRKGALVAIIKGTAADTVIEHLSKINLSKRKKVKEITLDMAPNMELIAKSCFPKAILVTDRFHVQKLAVEALQDMRIAHRWQAIDLENTEIELAKELRKSYKPILLENGDTHKQLLARSRYLLFKTENKWTPSQRFRASVLFKYYPDLEIAYKLTMQLKGIYEHTKDKMVALTRLARWYESVEQSGFKTFGTVKRSIAARYQTILNYFDNRSTNASAESFNAKIKAFRATLRGVNYIPYFLFRLTNIYA
ncbi:transposase [Dysgonomonas sp. Marseille-P4361]|uniref:ISAon1 family transposase n=1 Tax=Dysgonomonas sp. Marseille-P4361 TaxID=2161820 RepID=UPI001C882102|nr:transposase [Dysgonomonas sp. Marseille-P4361]